MCFFHIRVRQSVLQARNTNENFFAIWRSRMETPKHSSSSSIQNDSYFHPFFLLVFIQIHAPRDTIHMEKHPFGRSFFTRVSPKRARVRHWHGSVIGDAERSLSSAPPDEIHADQSLRRLSLFEYVCPTWRWVPRLIYNRTEAPTAAERRFEISIFGCVNKREKQEASCVLCYTINTDEMKVGVAKEAFTPTQVSWR